MLATKALGVIISSSPGREGERGIHDGPPSLPPSLWEDRSLGARKTKEEGGGGGFICRVMYTHYHEGRGDFKI